MARERTEAELEALLAKNAGRPIRWRHLSGITDGLAAEMAKFVTKKLAPVVDRVDALEKKSALIDVYRGVWQPGLHERGTIVTWGGSLWIATADTATKPETSDAWRLIVKRGRNGKDATP